LLFFISNDLSLSAWSFSNLFSSLLALPSSLSLPLPASNQQLDDAWRDALLSSDRRSKLFNKILKTRTAAARRRVAAASTAPAAVTSAATSNAAEARAWIEAWRTRTGASAPFVSTPSSKDVPPNVAEARAWISAWRRKKKFSLFSGMMMKGNSSSSSSPSFSLSGVFSALTATALEYGPKLALVGTLFACDRALQAGAKQIGLTFPPALVGMLFIVAGLSVLSSASPTAADRIQGAAAPGLDWVSRWLPLFYVPSLVVLPLAVRGIPGADLAKMLVVVVLGMPATLVATAAVAVAIRNAAKTPLGPPPPADAPAPFSRRHYVGWGSVAAFSGLAVALTGSQAAPGVSSLFLLASTILGYLFGVAAPPAFRSVIHPVISCAAAANAAVALVGMVTGSGYDTALASYLTKGAAGAAFGAGDVLMSLLGVVILSYGFRIHAQRSLIARHRLEIGGAALGSAAFSMFATAAAARQILGLSPEISRALAPRSVTVALALPIAQTLGAPASIAAAGVVLTGLLGANCAQALLDATGYKDPIARGLATAGAAHGLGTAALARSEPDALPFCALGYALIGVAATVLASLPPVTAALLAITA